MVFTDVQGLPPEAPSSRHRRDFVRSTAIWAMGARERWHGLRRSSTSGAATATEVLPDGFVRTAALIVGPGSGLGTDG